MVTSESMRFPETFGTVLAAKRAAEREATILLIVDRANTDGGASIELNSLSNEHRMMSSQALIAEVDSRSRASVPASSWQVEVWLS